MATCSTFLAWKIPWTEEHGGLQSVGSQSLYMTKHVSMHSLKGIHYLITVNILNLFMYLITLSTGGNFNLNV